MTRISIRNSGTNLRSSPEIAPGNGIAVLKANIVLDGTLQGDWYAVTLYLRKDVVREIPAAPVPPAGSIPYRSQWDTDANNRSADCGQTCCAMLAQWRGINVEINDLRFQSSGNGLSTAVDLTRNLISVNVPATWRYVSASEPIPTGSICLVQYGGFKRESVQDKSYYGGHWVVFVEDKGDSVVIHDPDYWGVHREEGAFKQIPRDEWLAAFRPVSSAGCVIVVLL